jgi:hypothetical protein
MRDRQRASHRSRLDLPTTIVPPAGRFCHLAFDTPDVLKIDSDVSPKYDGGMDATRI